MYDRVLYSAQLAAHMLRFEHEPEGRGSARVFAVRSAKRWYLPNEVAGALRIDLGVFECPRATRDCNVLGCPVHTPDCSWPIHDALLAYVQLELAMKGQ